MLPEPVQRILYPYSINTDDGSDDDNDAGGNSDARRTNSMKALCNRTHSTDTVGSRNTAGSTRKDNTRNSLPGIRTQFRPTPQRQNAAPKRKRIHLPPV
jgi:hypothetical protein